jgi:hypothetical protein
MSPWRAVVIAGAIGAAFTAACASEGECRYNSDCTAAYCSEGVCKKDCIDAAIDCPPGYQCNAVAQCQLPTGGVDASVPGTDGGLKDASTSDGPGPDGGPVTPGTKLLLDACLSDADCSSGLCKPYYVGGASRCTKPCTTNAQCMQGTRCIDFAGQKRCTVGDVGRPCNTAGQCSFACLLVQQYCTTPCATGSDCPNGFGCQDVGNPAQKVCVKAAAPCEAGSTDACIAAAACDTTGLVSACTLACGSAADCPQRAAGLPPWTCDGVCRRPGDVYGPLAGGQPAEYACNAASTVVSICNDGQHMNFGSFTVPLPPPVDCAAANTTPGAGGDSCVDSCRYQGGCAFGYGCTALGSVAGGRIGLCLPSNGAGEVGVSCTQDGQCAFGHCNRNTSKCSRDCTVDGLCPSGSTCGAGATPPVDGQPFRRCE